MGRPPADGRRPDPEFADIDRAADALFRRLDEPTHTCGGMMWGGSGHPDPCPGCEQESTEVDRD